MAVIEEGIKNLKRIDSGKVKRMEYDLNWGNVDKEELLKASIMSVDNYKLLIRVLEVCVRGR